MKKTLALLLCAAMLATAAACGASAPPPQDVPSPAAGGPAGSAPASPAPAETPATLTFMRMGSPEQATPIFAPIIEAYQAANPNVKIEFSVIGWNEALTKCKLLLSSGQFPDVGFMSQIGYEFAENGYLEELTPYFERDAAFKEDFIPSLFEGVKYKGKIYWSPCAVGAFSMWYNAALFEQAGLDPDKPPQTLEELVEFAKIIQEKTGVAGLAVGAKPLSDLTHVFMSVYASNAGVSLWDSDSLTLTMAQNQEAALKSLAFMRTLVEEDIHQPNPIEIDFYGGRSLLRDHQVAMTIDGVWALKEFKSQLEDGTMTLRSAPFPAGERGSNTLMGIGGWCIPASCQQKELAWDFIKFLQTPENQAAHGDQWGLLPILKSQLEMEAYQAYYWQPLVKQIETSHGIIAHPQTTYIEDTIAQAVSECMMGKKSPQETLDGIVQEVDGILNK